MLDFSLNFFRMANAGEFLIQPMHLRVFGFDLLDGGQCSFGPVCPGVRLDQLGPDFIEPRGAGRIAVARDWRRRGRRIVTAGPWAAGSCGPSARRRTPESCSCLSFALVAVALAIDFFRNAAQMLDVLARVRTVDGIDHARLGVAELIGDGAGADARFDGVHRE